MSDVQIGELTPRLSALIEQAKDEGRDARLLETPDRRLGKLANEAEAIEERHARHARLSWARRAVDADRIHADRGRALELLREAIRVGIEARDLDAELISGHVRNGLEAKEEIARLQAGNERLRALVGGAGR